MAFIRPIDNVRLFPYEYFTGADVELFVGPRKLTDISAISYQVTEQLLPIFGYASRTFDDMAQGTRLASGQIMLPFRSSGGLMEEVEKLWVKEQLEEEPDPLPAPNALRSEIASIAERYQARFWGEEQMDVKEPTFFPKQPFNIRIRFADDPAKDRVLVDVYLQSLGSTADPSGEAILDAYAFQARDVKWLRKSV